MKILSTLLALALSLSAEDKVKEYPVEVAPFRISTELKGTLIPTKSQTLKLTPERWKSFTIESLPEHGSQIQAGEPLIVFETKKFEKAVKSLEMELESKKLKLQIAERELAEMQLRNEITLADKKRKLENLEEDLKYYRETGLPARKVESQHSVTRSKNYLSYQKEELDQLQKMYNEDDLTEETEEIILTRQKTSVRDAEMNLEKNKREHALRLETTFPRSVISAENKVEDARISYATAKLNLKRSHDLKKIDVAKLAIEVTEAEEALSETQIDGEFFANNAKFDGIVVYGEFTDGKWKQGKTAEFLKVGSSVPTRTALLTLVAKDSPLALTASLKPEKAKSFAESLANRETESPAVTVASFPNLAGEYLVTLAEQPAAEFQAPGLTTEQEVTFYEKEDAITLPKDAIQEKADGTYFVLVKLSEGDPEERTVELGRSHEDQTEILSGLEEGQVVLLP